MYHYDNAYLSLRMRLLPQAAILTMRYFMVVHTVT